MHLDVGSAKVDIVAPLSLQSAILLRLGMNKLFVIR